MFEAAELGQTLSDKDYQKQVKQLREQMLDMQYKLMQAGFSVILVIAGDDRSGRHETINVLHEWMDPRFLEANAYGPPTEEEMARPFFWRYWRDLPPKGRIGIYLRDWATFSIAQRMDRVIDDNRMEQRIYFINRFEKALVQDGTLIVKCWLHLPKDELKARLKKHEKNPEKFWRISAGDERILKKYKSLSTLTEKVLRLTNTAEAPWHIIESTDDNYRNIKVGEVLLQAINNRFASTQASDRRKPVTPQTSNGNTLTILDKVDLSASLSAADYERKLAKWQSKCARLFSAAQQKGLSNVLVFEGWDAAGKGGAIRRITATLDAGFYRVVPISAPSDEALARHYLWRFWRHLPRQGGTVIFDRSWYGRVLVERVEGLAQPSEWQRAYYEINDFEEQMKTHGVVLNKFWLHIDPDEQLRRFKEREATPHKRFKIGPEDYRNRERWDDYEVAANEMIKYTSTEYAPWHLIAANCKRHGRIEVLRKMASSLEEALDRK